MESDTRSLLTAGVAAGPFYLAVGLIQALVREGFRFAKHPLSVLANGPGGWVQTANFVLSGLMVLAAAVGLARALRPNGRGASIALGLFGAGMLVAAGFPADPMDGFPLGTPAGPPSSISPTGLIHFAAGGIGFVFLAVSCFFAAAALSRRGESALARLSLVSGLLVLLGFFGGFALPLGVAGIWVTVVAGWAWLSLVCLRLRAL